MKINKKKPGMAHFLESQLSIRRNGENSFFVLPSQIVQQNNIIEIHGIVLTRQ